MTACESVSVQTKKPRSFRDFPWSVLRHSLLVPLGGLNSRKNRRENRRLLVKATHNQTHLAALSIRNSLG